MADAPKPPLPEVKTMTVLEQIKKLDEQRANLLNSAKDEAMKKAEAAIGDLNSLGFSYRLVEGDAPKTRKAAVIRQLDPDKPCQTCGFKTIPPHDSRKHRAQGEGKKAFTAKELEAFGLKKG